MTERWPNQSQLAYARRGSLFFYDQFEEHDLWGKNLHEELQSVYTKDCKYCVMIVSQSYLDRMWTTFERQQIVDRLAKEKGEGSVLPVRLDGFNETIPGMSDGIGYISATSDDAEKIVSLLVRKIAQPTTSTRSNDSKKTKGRIIKSAQQEPIKNFGELNDFMQGYRTQRVPVPKDPFLPGCPVSTAIALLEFAKKHRTPKKETLAIHSYDSWLALKRLGLMDADCRAVLPKQAGNRQLDQVVRDAAKEEDTVVCVANFLRLHPIAVAEDIGDLVADWLGRKWVTSTREGHGSKLRQWAMWTFPDVAELVSSKVKDPSDNYSRLSGHVRARTPRMSEEDWYRARPLFLKGLSPYQVSKEIGISKSTLYNYQEMIMNGEAYPFARPVARGRKLDTIPRAISEEQWMCAHTLLTNDFTVERVSEVLSIKLKTLKKYRSRIMAGEKYPGQKSPRKK